MNQLLHHAHHSFAAEGKNREIVTASRWVERAFVVVNPHDVSMDDGQGHGTVSTAARDELGMLAERGKVHLMFPDLRQLN